MPELGEDLPFPIGKVWDASIVVLQKAKWNVTKADREQGEIEVKAIMDSLTWTEAFYINLEKIADEATRVRVGRIGLSQPFDWGIGRQYARSFLSRLETELSGSPISSEKS